MTIQSLQVYTIIVPNVAGHEAVPAILLGTFQGYTAAQVTGAWRYGTRTYFDASTQYTIAAPDSMSTLNTVRDCANRIGVLLGETAMYVGHPRGADILTVDTFITEVAA